MKTIKPKAIFVFALAASLFLGCHSKLKKGYYIDQQIPSDIRDQFHEQNKLFFEYVKTNYQVKLRGILSKELLDGKGLTVRRLDRIKNAITENDYQLYKEYYVVNKWRDADTIPAGNAAKDFSLKYSGITKEMYFAFFLPKSGDNKKMISLIYCNFDYGWRLFSIETLPYTINGKTAPELYEQAKKEKEKGYLSGAINSMSTANACIKPNYMWEYKDDQKMTEFYGELMSEASKLKFPIMVPSMSSPIAVFHVWQQRMLDGALYPDVCYVTKVNIKDTAAVRKEYLALRKQIDKALPGIDKDTKCVIYSAYNKMPGREFTDHFDITDKLQ